MKKNIFSNIVIIIAIALLIFLILCGFKAFDRIVKSYTFDAIALNTIEDSFDNKYLYFTREFTNGTITDYARIYGKSDFEKIRINEPIKIRMYIIESVIFNYTYVQYEIA